MPLVSNPKRSFVITLICCLFYAWMAKGVHVQSGTELVSYSAKFKVEVLTF